MKKVYALLFYYLFRLIVLRSLLYASEFNLKNTFFNFYSNYQLHQEPVTGIKLYNDAFKFNFYTKSSQENFGIELNTNDLFKKMYFVFQTGNLTASEGYSKLKNPVLSSALSPFSVALNKADSIYSSLPTAQSFSKPVSYYLEARSKFLYCNWFFNPAQNENVFSALFPFRLKKSQSIFASCNMGFFNFTEYSNDNWYYDNQFYYHQGEHFCINSMLSYTNKNFNLLFIVSGYENSLKQFLPVFRMETSFRTKNFYNSFWLFYNPNQYLLTAQDSLLPKCLQLKYSVQYIQRDSSSLLSYLKSGITLYYKRNFNDSSKDDFKLSLGTYLRFYEFAVTLMENVNFLSQIKQDLIQWSIEELNTKLNARFYFSVVDCELGAKIAYIPKKSLNHYSIIQNYSFDCGFDSNPAFKLGADAEIEHKNKQFSKVTLDTSLKSAFTYRYVKFNFSVGAKIL